MTQHACFSLMTHIKQSLSVKVCDTTAGNGASFRTHARTDGGGGGRTDRRGSRNSYLDMNVLGFFSEYLDSHVLHSKGFFPS